MDRPRLKPVTLAEFALLHPDLTELRRDFHAHPELAYREHRTAARVAQCLQALGMEVHTGIGRTGVVGVLEGRSSTGRGVALRSDMDAIAATEEADRPYRSTTPDCMHGCGHDGHMAVLLGAARYLASTRRFDGRVVFIFQPAEEGHAGARAMLDDGLFERFPVDAVFALHNWPSLPEGSVGLNRGPMMAAIDRFEIAVTGKGGHGAHPQEAIDPILVGSHIVQALHTIVSRSVDPLQSAVVSLQSFQAGRPEALSVIPGTAHLAGMVKWFDPNVQALVRKRMEAVVEHAAAVFGAQARLSYEPLYPPTVNTPAEAELVERVAARVLGPGCVIRDLPPSMGSEDFAFMLQRRPGAYFRLGQGMGNGVFLHHPEYDFNDRTIPAGAAMFAGIVEEYLSQ
jgi:hippurate hydrolase